MFHNHDQANGQHAFDGLPELLTVAEAGSLLRVSRSTIYQLMDAGQLTYVRIGTRCRRVPKEALVDLLERSLTGGWATGPATLPMPKPQPQLAAQPTTAPQARRRTPPPRPPRPRRVS